MAHLYHSGAPQILCIFLVLIFVDWTNGQVATGQSDRTQQELALLGWTSGVRMAYCQETTIQEMIDPFKESIARMLNRHCRTPSACGLRKSVTFNKQQIVLLDGFPRREHRAISFRFFVVLPYDAVPIDKRPDKPLVPSRILSDMLEGQLAELTHGLGWHVLHNEKYPRFDPTTTFFNRWLILIGVLAGLCMIFLAYWVTSFTSGSSLYAGGWLVRGSSGGKNAALRRTMEIIEEQKYRFALYDSQKSGVIVGPMVGGPLLPATKTVIIYKTNARVQEVHAPPKSLATSHSTAKSAEASRAMPMPESGGKAGAEAGGVHHAQTKGKKKDDHHHHPHSPLPQQHQQAQPQQVQHQQLVAYPTVHQAIAIPQKSVGPKRISTESADSTKRMGKPQQPPSFEAMPSIDEKEMAEMADCVPEIVIVHAPRDSISSIDTSATPGGSRKMSASQRRQSRRFSIAEEFKRRKSLFGGGSKDRGGGDRNRSTSRGGTNPQQQERQKRWKASSIALSKFSIVGSGGRNK